MELDNLLKELAEELVGLKCSAVVGTDGLVISQDVVSDDVDVPTLMVMFSSVFNTTKKASIEIGESGKLCSIHTFDNHYIIMQEIGDLGFFVITCIDVASGNIGKARYMMNKLENRFYEELK
jgi:predicted regulator of Ras-like GTPase activity (Roadblock/LC7/MglB family)